MRRSMADADGDGEETSGLTAPPHSDAPTVAASDSGIARVPEEIRRRDPEAYEPKAVCIGPYFHALRHSPSFARMEQHKRWCVNRMLRRSGRSIEPLVQEFLLRLKQATNRNPFRELYAEPVAMTEEEMGLTLLFDGCFVVHFLLRHDPAKGAEYEYWVRLDAGELDEEYETLQWERPWEWGLVAVDMLLLENQIPFVAVRILFDILKTDHEKGVDLTTCACHVFSKYLPAGMRASPLPIRYGDVRCLLQLLYRSLLPRPEPGSRYREPPPTPPRTGMDPVKKLETDGVGVRPRRPRPWSHLHEPLSFLDVVFRRGAVEIPQLEVSDVSIQLLQNLIAFEKCYHGTTSHVSNYAAFMDSLNADDRDTETLRRRRILNVQLSPAQPGLSFWSQCKQDIDPSPENYLSRLMVDVALYKEAMTGKKRTPMPMSDAMLCATLVTIALACMLPVLYRYTAS